jgi:hypothetical protein
MNEDTFRRDAVLDNSVQKEPDGETAHWLRLEGWVRELSNVVALPGV